MLNIMGDGAVMNELLAGRQLRPVQKLRFDEADGNKSREVKRAAGSSWVSTQFLAYLNSGELAYCTIVVAGAGLHTSGTCKDIKAVNIRRRSKTVIIADFGLDSFDTPPTEIDPTTIECVIPHTKLHENKLVQKIPKEEQIYLCSLIKWDNLSKMPSEQSVEGYFENTTHYTNVPYIVRSGLHGYGQILRKEFDIQRIHRALRDVRLDLSLYDDNPSLANDWIARMKTSIASSRLVVSSVDRNAMQTYKDALQYHEYVDEIVDQNATTTSESGLSFADWRCDVEEADFLPMQITRCWSQVRTGQGTSDINADNEEPEGGDELYDRLIIVTIDHSCYPVPINALRLLVTAGDDVFETELNQLKNKQTSLRAVEKDQFKSEVEDARDAVTFGSPKTYRDSGQRDIVTQTCRYTRHSSQFFSQIGAWTHFELFIHAIRNNPLCESMAVASLPIFKYKDGEQYYFGDDDINYDDINPDITPGAYDEEAERVQEWVQINQSKDERIERVVENFKENALNCLDVYLRKAKWCINHPEGGVYKIIGTEIPVTNPFFLYTGPTKSQKAPQKPFFFESRIDAIVEVNHKTNGKVVLVVEWKCLMESNTDKYENVDRAMAYNTQKQAFANALLFYLDTNIEPFRVVTVHATRCEDHDHHEASNVAGYVRSVPFSLHRPTWPTRCEWATRFLLTPFGQDSTSKARWRAPVEPHIKKITESNPTIRTKAAYIDKNMSCDDFELLLALTQHRRECFTETKGSADWESAMNSALFDPDLAAVHCFPGCQLLRRLAKISGITVKNEDQIITKYSTACKTSNFKFRELKYASGKKNEPQVRRQVRVSVDDFPPLSLELTVEAIVHEPPRQPRPTTIDACTLIVTLDKDTRYVTQAQNFIKKKCNQDRNCRQEVHLKKTTTTKAKRSCTTNALYEPEPDDGTKDANTRARSRVNQIIQNKLDILTDLLVILLNQNDASIKHMWQTVLLFCEWRGDEKHLVFHDDFEIGLRLGSAAHCFKYKEVNAYKTKPKTEEAKRKVIRTMATRTLHRLINSRVLETYLPLVHTQVHKISRRSAQTKSISEARVAHLDLFDPSTEAEIRMMKAEMKKFDIAAVEEWERQNPPGNHIRWKDWNWRGRRTIDKDIENDTPFGFNRDTPVLQKFTHRSMRHKWHEDALQLVDRTFTQNCCDDILNFVARTLPSVCKNGANLRKIYADIIDDDTFLDPPTP